MASGARQDSSSDWEPDSDQGEQSEEELSEDNRDEGADGDSQWGETPGVFHEIPFAGNCGLKVPIPGENRPIDYFSMLLDDEFLESLVFDVNKYADDMIHLPSTTASSRINKWKDHRVSLRELKVFLAVVLHTGTIRLDHLQDYWKTDSLFNIPFFREQMSRDRFLIILRCLNVSNLSALKDKKIGCEGLAKKFIDFFNNKMTDVFSPSRELCVDEPVFVSNGRIYSRQDVQDRRGMKLYALCEPRGIAVRFLIDSDVRKVGGKDHSANVILNLMEAHFNKGHALYTDSYYSGVPLARELLSKDTLCTGALSPDRKFLPRVVKNAKLKNGEYVARYSDGVVVGKWTLRGTIMYVSTEHENEIVYTMNHFGDLGGKPLPVIKYNATMKAVDRVEQLLSFYPCQSTNLNWHKKVFLHVIHLITINSWLIFNMMNPDKKTPLYDFRIHVIRALLPVAVARPPPPVGKCGEPHVLSKIEKRDDKKRRMARRCRVCSQNGRYTKTIFCCAQCPKQPGLCAVGCFDKYHKSM